MFGQTKVEKNLFKLKYADTELEVVVCVRRTEQIFWKGKIFFCTIGMLLIQKM